MEQTTFQAWAIVELFGHSKIAGACSEQSIAGSNMLRVDVPETTHQPAFTRLLGSGAIYAINPVTEEIARHWAEILKAAPIDAWDIRRFIEKNNKSLEMGSSEEDDN